MKSFSQFVSETTEKEIFFTFGRFNPPSAAYSKLFEKLATLSKGKYRIYASDAVDIKRNPLLHETKVRWMRKMFPKHARAIVEEAADDAQSVCSELYKQGFTKVTFVTSEDQKILSETLLNRYNGVDLDTGFYNFHDGIQVHTVENCSDESRMIEAAAANDLEAFHRCLPESFEQYEELFNDVRKAIGYKPTKNFRKHVQLQSVSERREKYVAGDIFEVGNDVVIKETQEVAKIVQCGSNYLVVESNGKRLRKWLDAVELLEKAEDWVKFSPALHTLNIPRANLPQVRSEDREGLVQYLGKCGVESQNTSCDPKVLKPTQAEYSPAKVQKAKEFNGSDRPLLVSADGHVLDGHHQWMAHLENGTNPIRVLRFSQPISQLIPLANAYMQGTSSFKESFIHPVPAPIVHRTPSLSGIPISKIRSLRK